MEFWKIDVSCLTESLAAGHCRSSSITHSYVDDFAQVSALIIILEASSLNIAFFSKKITAQNVDPFFE